MTVTSSSCSAGNNI